MLSEPEWLTLDEIIELNELIVQATGEPFLLRDRGLLESAWSNPVNLYHYQNEEDIVALAVAFLFAIARNHPFEQGNKRTAFEAAVHFLNLNGYELNIPDIETVAKTMVDVIAHEAPQDFFEQVFRQYVVELDDED